jgi:hypothetical protein
MSNDELMTRLRSATGGGRSQNDKLKKYAAPFGIRHSVIPSAFVIRISSLSEFVFI